MPADDVRTSRDMTPILGVDDEAPTRLGVLVALEDFDPGCSLEQDFQPGQ